MLTIKELHIQGFKKVIEATDPETKLHCIIAIHNTDLGPALGGARIRSYHDKEEALQDVLRLSRAMTYKSAVAESGLGGGKSVLIAQPSDKSEKLLLSFGKVVDSLKGDYIVAEDIGTSPEDMAIIRRATPYVAALVNEKSSGDPSRFTAWGVYRGIQAVAKTLWGSPSLANKVIALQGLGSVGGKLANILFWEGAQLILSDIDEKKLHNQALLYGAQTIPADNFNSAQCDILSPCALGGIINDETIAKMRCKAVAGGANNQLLLPSHGRKLMEKGILYAPDYIINSGGIINAAAEFDPNGYNPVVARDKVNHLYDILLQVFDIAKKENRPTSDIADDLAEYNLLHGVGKRAVPINFRR